MSTLEVRDTYSIITSHNLDVCLWNGANKQNTTKWLDTLYPTVLLIIIIIIDCFLCDYYRNLRVTERRRSNTQNVWENQYTYINSTRCTLFNNLHHLRKWQRVANLFYIYFSLIFVLRRVILYK